MNGPTPSRCERCGEAIYWAKSKGRGLMPVDAEPSDRGTIALYWHRDSQTFTCRVISGQIDSYAGLRRRLHLETCPDALKEAA